MLIVLLTENIAGFYVIWTFLVIVICLLGLFYLYIKYKHTQNKYFQIQQDFKNAQSEINFRKKTEAELRNSEEKLRLLFRKSPIGIAQYDEFLRLNNSNDRFSKILKIDKNNLTNLNLSKLFDDRVTDILRKAIASKSRIYRIEHCLSSREGEIFISFTAKPYYYYNGFTIIKSGILIIEDITERKKAENALLNSQFKQDNLLKLLPDDIFLFDKNGICVEAISNNSRNSFKETKQIIGKNVRHIFPKNLSDHITFIFARAFECKDIQIFEYSVEYSGMINLFEARIIPHDDNMLVAVIRNVSRQKKLPHSTITSLLPDSIPSEINVTYYPNIKLPASSQGHENTSFFNLNFEGISILLADDSLERREEVKRGLQNLNINLIEATNGEEAIQKASLFLPDLILMKTHIPIIDGITATKKIKHALDSKLRKIPIIAICDHNLSELTPENAKLFVFCMVSPSSKDELIKLLAKYLPYTRTHDSLLYSLVDNRSHIENKDEDLLSCFQNELLPFFKKIQNNPDQKDILEFAKQLKEKGEKHNFPQLKEYGELLYSESYQSDIHILTKTLKEFLQVAKMITSNN
jgi:PAS domain S-box-containing protein